VSIKLNLEGDYPEGSETSLVSRSPFAFLVERKKEAYSNFKWGENTRKKDFMNPIFWGGGGGWGTRLIPEQNQFMMERWDTEEEAREGANHTQESK